MKQKVNIPWNKVVTVCSVCLVTQSCPALCDPMDCSPQGSSVHGIFQARIQEWAAISYSREYLPNPGIKHTSFASPASVYRCFSTTPPGKPHNNFSSSNIAFIIFLVRASLIAQLVKNLPAMQATPVWSLGSGRSPGEGNGNPLQYSCLGNLMDRGTWLAAVHGVTKSWTRLSGYHTTG